MKKADNFTSVLISYQLTTQATVRVQKQIYDYSGEVAYIMPRDGDAQSTTFKYLEEYAIENSFAIQVGGTFTGTTSVHNGAVFQDWKSKVLLFGWTIDDFATNDNAQVWQKMYDLGYRMIMTNDYLGMIKFAATKYSFD